MTWQTHDVFNQFDELSDYNVFATDAALTEAVHGADAGWALAALDSYGTTIGSAESFRQADEANRHPPELQVFDRRGRRIDQVDFHPSWHALMAQYRGAGWVSLSARDTRPGRWVADAAGLYLHSQVESGTTCPSIMTWASHPAARARDRAVAGAEGQALQRRLRRTRPSAGGQALDLCRHGHDREAGRLGRARQHHRGHAAGRRRAGPRVRDPRPQVVLLGADVRRAPGRRAHQGRRAFAASSCRAGSRTAAGTRCRSSA